MPLTIRLEDERRTVLADVFDLRNAITRLSDVASAQLSIAQTIDAYGDTMMNQLQAPLLLADLERLLAQTTRIEDVEVLSGVMDLARRCQEETHVYLWFYGD
jgi:hypothetical protein